MMAMPDPLEERLHTARLLEVYGALLTPRRQRLLRLYYHDDFSLGEIAQRQKISRQAVFDSLRRSVDELQRLEDSLHLVESADQQSRQRKHQADRFDALEEAIARLEGQVDRRTIDLLLEKVAGLRRASR